MNHFTDLSPLKTRLNSWRHQQQKIGLVTTMGNLHHGHLALVEKIKSHVDRVIVSIFVNPLQFGVNEDFGTYPRTLAADLEKLAPYGVDAIFTPTTETIYPDGTPQTCVDIPTLSNQLCGQTRPHHFAGVCTVLTKFFNMIQPDVVIYGEKDFQQLAVIRQMVKDLNFPITVLSLPTQRETDGLASSSRNQYLSATERQQAPLLYAALTTLAECIRAGQRDYHTLCEQTSDTLNAQGFTVDYLTVRDAQTLQNPVAEQTQTLVILVAAYLGKTRLIDNLSLTVNPLSTR